MYLYGNAYRKLLLKISASIFNSLTTGKEIRATLFSIGSSFHLGISRREITFLCLCVINITPECNYFTSAWGKMCVPRARCVPISLRFVVSVSLVDDDNTPPRRDDYIFFFFLPTYLQSRWRERERERERGVRSALSKAQMTHTPIHR